MKWSLCAVSPTALVITKLLPLSVCLELKLPQSPRNRGEMIAERDIMFAKLDYGPPFIVSALDR